MDYRRMSPEAKAELLALHPRCALCEKSAVLVDHCHTSHEVRGALCRRCNSRLGSLEAALRLPASGTFQSAAHDLHRAVERGERLSARVARADLAYLGIPGPEYGRRLRAVHAQLVLPYVYWTPITGTALTRATPWTKIGPLADEQEARRHAARLAARPAPPHLHIVLAREPDDGVNSPHPRGLLAGFETEGATRARIELQKAAPPPDLGAWEAKCRDYTDLVVPVLLSRPLTDRQIRDAHFNPREKLPRTRVALLEMIGDRYAAGWLDLAVRIALEDLAADLPDSRWAVFSRARYHWRALLEHWRRRQTGLRPA
ncbi:endonuclease domain-containing protein [Kitasatospora sp. NPDC088783]|uniref:endonuclease domain-containing protein n=1 Tax=Kitasatospora sp. NPDC088783 TaxID=3364077 RepID=UPI003811432D